jgi:hypothetical protein
MILRDLEWRPHTDNFSAKTWDQATVQLRPTKGELKFYYAHSGATGSVEMGTYVIYLDQNPDSLSRQSLELYRAVGEFEAQLWLDNFVQTHRHLFPDHLPDEVIDA